MNSEPTPSVTSVIPGLPCSDMLFECLPTRAAGRAIGVARLNRPGALNALNLPMVQAMLSQFRAWASDTSIVAVVLMGQGPKGFCAGGDVAEVVRQVRSGRPDRFVYGDAFFEVEYQLDMLIHTYPKPFITWAHGVDMGGGVGLSVAGSERIVSEGLKMAMPEIHIGLFPDVGGGWFLNRVPGEAGLLLALTGAIIHEGDALHAGLADHAIGLARQPEFMQGLMDLRWTGQAAHDRVLLRGLCLSFAAEHALVVPPSDLARLAPAIRAIGAQPSAGQVLRALEREAAHESWFERPLANLSQGSPTGACVTFEYMRRSRKLGIGQVLALDLILARQCQRHADFPEGVRALLIDKTRDARWSCAHIEAVSEQEVAGFFEPV